MGKYRFLLINAFRLEPGSDFKLRAFSGPKEEQLHNYDDVKPFLADIDWDLHPGAACRECYRYSSYKSKCGNDQRPIWL